MKRLLSFHLVPILAGLLLMLCWPTEATAAAKSYKPARDEDITSLTEFTLKVRNATAVRLADEVADSDITLVHNEQTYELNKDFTVAISDLKQEEGDNYEYFYVTFTMKNPITSEGDCTVTIATGALLYDDSNGTDKELSQSSWSFHIGEREPEITFTASGLKDINESVKQFSLSFYNHGNSINGWMAANANPETMITIKRLGETIDYDHTVVSSQIRFDSPITVGGSYEVVYAPGFFELTLAGGKKMYSPEISVKFIVTPKGETTPKAGSRLLRLGNVSLKFDDSVKEVRFKDETNTNVILQQHLNIMGGSWFPLTDRMKPAEGSATEYIIDPVYTKPGNIRIQCKAGAFILTLQDGTEVENSEILSEMTIIEQAPPVEIGDDKWVPVKDIELFDDPEGVEAVLVFATDGTFAINQMPGKNQRRKAETVLNGTYRSVVMTNEMTSYYNDAATFFGGEDIKMSRNQLNVPVAAEIPENAALVKVKKEDKGYTFHVSNSHLVYGGKTSTPDSPVTPGYLCPYPDINVGKNYLGIADEPYYNTIAINDYGETKIYSKQRDGKHDLLTLMNITSFAADQTQAVFQYIEAALDYGYLYLFVREKDYKLPQLAATPKSSTTVDAPTEPVSEGATTAIQNISFRFREAETAAYNTGTLTATFNGEALPASAIECDNEYPVNVKVTLPLNTTGELKINGPAGWYKLTDIEENVTDSEAFTYTLNLKKKLFVTDKVEITATPATGSELGAVSSITIVLPEGVKAKLNPEMEDATADVRLNGSECSAPVMTSDLMFRYRPEFTGTGKYEFTLPEGLYILTLADGSEALSPTIAIEYILKNVLETADVKATTIPADKANLDEAFSTFTVTFEGVTEATVNATASIDDFTIKVGEELLKYTEGFSEGDNQTTMILDTPADGTNIPVSVKIAEGFYVLTMADESQKGSPAVNVAFTIKGENGIIGISAENTGTVYTLDGMVVARDANAETMSQLPAGVYVLNGKVIIRK